MINSSKKVLMVTDNKCDMMIEIKVKNNEIEVERH